MDRGVSLHVCGSCACLAAIRSLGGFLLHDWIATLRSYMAPDLLYVVLSKRGLGKDKGLQGGGI